MSNIKRQNSFKYLLLSGLSSVAFLVYTAVFVQIPDNNLKVHFFDIGQGAAIFIEAPNKNQVLIDGGPDNIILEKLGQVMPFYDKTIDLIVLTHPDADHLNGLIDVLKRYEVKQIMETGILDNSANYQVWHNLIKEKNIPISYAFLGETVNLDDGITMDILSPSKNLAGSETSNSNSTSIVSRLIYGENEFLFTGDADNSVEWQLVSMGLNLSADVLNVGHHGSKNSTSDIFLQAVNPRIAVIQAGRNNKYGHPHQEVLQKLKNVLILRTDINKDINFKSDGKNISYY